MLIFHQSMTNKPVHDQPTRPIHPIIHPSYNQSPHLSTPIVKTGLAHIGSALARIDTGHDNRRSIGEQSSYEPSNKCTMGTDRGVSTEDDSDNPCSTRCHSSVNPPRQSQTNLLKQFSNLIPIYQSNPNP